VFENIYENQFLKATTFALLWALSLSVRVLWCISFTLLCEFPSPFHAVQDKSPFENLKCNSEFPK